MHAVNDPPVYPHDPIEQIADDAFMVRGRIRMNALMTITRNMAIVRDDDQLTLVNPIRLNPEGEDRLRSLGNVIRIMRLGPFHGVDDPYYVRQFQAEFWCQPGGRKYTEPAIDVEMQQDCALPFTDAELFVFRDTVQPESALLLRRESGLLLTCDSIQHYGDYRHNNLVARLVMPFVGFPRTTVVGPIWLRYMTPDGGSLRSDFERLLALPFDALLGAHGSFLPSGAKVSVRAAIHRAFGDN